MATINLYDLIGGVHYLGYHTEETMTYSLDQAKTFTLVTSNRKEALEVTEEHAGRALVWMIEGRPGGGPTRYYLAEVFRPTGRAEIAAPEDYEGARKRFDYRIEGEGVAFGSDIPLNDLPWFPAFRRSSGNFGFGLRLLCDETVRGELVRLCKPYL